MTQEISSLTHREKDQVERLRLILESEQNRKVSFAEASEIGSNLISFFETLAEGSDNQIADNTA
jgi:hypothetical protein